MKQKTLVLLAVLLTIAASLALITSAGSVAYGAAPTTGTIPYSGQLSDQLGQPVADGGYAFRFALYDAAQGGELLWSESQSGVKVTGGAFTAQLGSVAAIPETARAKSAWLEVSVRGPDEAVFTELSPRQLLETAVASEPASPSAAATCAHDHFGESWSGSTVYGTSFQVENTGTYGTAIKGTAKEYGVYGSSPDTAVYGRSDGGVGVYGDGVNNGTGVIGNSGTGIGVVAWSNSGAALVIHGSINVDGSGIDSDTPVFIHKVNTALGGNICSIQSYSTVIDNPITNNQPDAILIVTPNFGANNTGLNPVNAFPAVYYDATGQCGKGTGKWVIYNISTTPQINNSLFNVIVVY
jgi:hypothetical protein